MAMQESQLKNIIEAALMSSSFPITFSKLTELFHEEDAVTDEHIHHAIESLRDDYFTHGIELVEVASGYRFQARQEVMPWLCRLQEDKPSRYSRAVLETLALIAYRQPITRAEIEDVRGVAVSTQIIKTLQEREWIRVIGHRDVPGRPALFATTKSFLDDLNLHSLSDLPTLAELKDLDAVEGELEQLRLDIENEKVNENTVRLDSVDAEALSEGDHEHDENCQHDQVDQCELDHEHNEECQQPHVHGEHCHLDDEDEEESHHNHECELNHEHDDECQQLHVHGEHCHHEDEETLQDLECELNHEHNEDCQHPHRHSEHCEHDHEDEEDSEYEHVHHHLHDDECDHELEDDDELIEVEQSLDEEAEVG